MNETSLLPDGSLCPLCGGKSTVADSRTFGGPLRRRRKCLTPACGRRWSTYEVPVEMLSLSDGGVYERCRRALIAVERAQAELVEALASMRSAAASMGAVAPANGSGAVLDATVDGQDATAGE
jgi:hypothetical protein